MSQVKPERVINGTWGSLWCNDDELAQTIACEAKITIEKTEVNQTGTLAKGYKVTGTDGKGSLKLNKVSSYFIKLIGDNIKQGKSTPCQLRSKLADPEAAGSEDILLTGVTFDELEIINWEARKLTEENIPFSFTGFEVLESIDQSAAME